MGLHILVLAGGSGTRLWPLSRRSTPEAPAAAGAGRRDAAPRDRSSASSGWATASGWSRRRRRPTAAGRRSPVSDCRPTRSSRSRALAGPGRRSRWRSALIAREDPDALIASVHADHRVSDPTRIARRCSRRPDGRRHRRARDRRARPRGAGHRLRLHRGRRASRPERVAATAGQPAGDRGGGRRLPGVRVGGIQGEAVGGGGPDATSTTAGTSGISASSPGRHDGSSPSCTAADPDLGAAVDRVVDARLGGDDAAGHPALRGADDCRPSNRWSSSGPAGSPSSRRRSAGRISGHGRTSVQCPRRRRRRRRRRQRDRRRRGHHAIARDCTVVSRSGRVVAVAGVDGLVVVDTPDAVLVVPADQSQLVKEVVDQLRAAAHDDVL